MKYSENAVNIITAKRFKGIGRAWIAKNLRGNESIEQIVSLLNSNSRRENAVNINDFNEEKRRVIGQLDSINEYCDGVVALGDSKFPRYRGVVKDSERPIFLFYKGDISLLNFDNYNITVIGLLTPDENIEARERKIVAEIVKRGITVVSGLAYGCDSIAHKQALLGGKTVAVLPSSLQNIMPTRNKTLAYEIVENGGLLVTEYFDDHKSAMDLTSRYQERDRLQALFCDAIILAASYAQDSANRWKLFDQKLDSGARLAMGYAKEYCIPRAVMYDYNVDSYNPMFDLNRQLIEEHKDVTILTQKNLEELIGRIKSRKSGDLDTNSHQMNLFN
jgi:DNA processing protein